MPLPEPSPSSTAVVTGASSGIGREFARQLGARGHRVTLVARREGRLRELADELAGNGVQAEVVAADLSDESQRDRLAFELEQRELTVEILVNNAGFGIYRPLYASDRKRELEQVRVDVEAVVDLNARYVPGMVERRRGTVIVVSSAAGFQPLPGNGTYSASKAFAIVHAEALAAEVAPYGVTVTAVAPGLVETEFVETSEAAFAQHVPKLLWTDPERVVGDALHAAERGKRSVIPGGIVIKAALGPNRVIPTAITMPVARFLMRDELRRGQSTNSP
jgi:short-subunit dehydrogenase